MAETTADVRRDIEMTRERMSDTIAELERKLNVSQIVREHPWPSIGLAFGAGLLLSGSRADVKASAATLAATQGASSKIGPALDDIVARFMSGVTMALNDRVDHWVNEVKSVLGAPVEQGTGRRGSEGRASGASPSSMTSELRETGDWAGNAPGGTSPRSPGGLGTQGPYGTQSPGAGTWSGQYSEPPRAD